MENDEERTYYEESPVHRAMKDGTMAATYIVGLTVGLVGVLVGWLMAGGNKHAGK